jgi:hypothetical protein
MSNPFLKEARSTVNSKLHKMGGSGPDQYARAEKLAHAKYADGGVVGSVPEAKRDMENAFRKAQYENDKADTSRNRGQGPTEATATGMRITRGMKKGGCT